MPPENGWKGIANMRMTVRIYFYRSIWPFLSLFFFLKRATEDGQTFSSLRNGSRLHVRLGTVALVKQRWMFSWRQKALLWLKTLDNLWAVRRTLSLKCGWVSYPLVLRWRHSIFSPEVPPCYLKCHKKFNCRFALLNWHFHAHSTHTRTHTRTHTFAVVCGFWPVISS